MTTYEIENIGTFGTLAEALKHITPEVAIVCMIDGAATWRETADERGMIWLSAAQCRVLDDADLIALINAHERAGLDDDALDELLTRGGFDADSIEDGMIDGVDYWAACRTAAVRLGGALCPECSISIDNGHTFYAPDELDEIMPEVARMWAAIVQMMDDDTRESVQADLAPCTEAEFLAEYLRRAPSDLVIG